MHHAAREQAKTLIHGISRVQIHSKQTRSTAAASQLKHILNDAQVLQWQRQSLRAPMVKLDSQLTSHTLKYISAQ